ncbi:MAG: winged helix-turn-helix transcriptional regulator [Thermoplasmata archaeon]|nr:winged helix-turn-helix transcriptional regulator [Thermoplasmata archaeon]
MHQDIEVRRSIYNLIAEVPGIHFRELQRKLGLEVGTLDYHLNRMEKEGLIYAVKDRYYKRYYTKEVDARDFELMAVLRQEKPRRIVLHLLLNPGSTHAEIGKELNLALSTTTFYLDMLCRKGVVNAVRGEKVQYFVSESERAVNALIRYRQSFLDKLVDRFLEVWLESTASQTENL